MRYLSVCSGIEAASCAWHTLGWQPLAFSELAAFPRKVLAHHYPDVPLHGDFTQLRDQPWIGAADLLVGGTPCQSFSVAGLRGGLSDRRGNLSLEFVELAKHMQVPWVVWENVPGAISIDGGRVLATIIDNLTDAGYMVDAEVLDAQHFGVPQRRQRLFLVCELFDHGRKMRSPFFAATVVKCLSDLLLNALGAHCDPANGGAIGLQTATRFSSDGVRKRMKLLGLPLSGQPTSTTEAAVFMALLNDWAATLASCQNMPRSSDSHSETARQEQSCTADTFSPESQASLDFFTLQSCSTILDAIWSAASASTTSTATRPTTASAIFTCAEALLNIAQFTTASTTWLQNFCDEESCGLTALKEFTAYAKQAVSDLFAGVGSGCDWFGFATRAEVTARVIEQHLGVRASPDALLPITDSRIRNPAPRRQAGKGAASDATESAGIGGAIAALTASGRGVARVGESRGQDPVVPWPAEIAPTLNAQFGSKQGLDSQHINSGAGLFVPVAFHPTQDPIHSADGTTHALGCGSSGGQASVAVATPYAVRRLTPTECERLQGFPDGWTDITPGKTPDGPRYKALGNSMAVPVMAWIGRRIAEVSK